uniref:Uncharacterized protein n=1 Tax=Compsopogon caeruleus TaxID=31354 RepID=A0A7S1XFE3_9RHOD|mmetsp:Transcript_8265/g.16749  ORF Transcript_8265/g.16749 Transcript_8265/m.16749 type:complete len:129 (+) Transcript_8265:647-1033(+)
MRDDVPTHQTPIILLIVFVRQAKEEEGRFSILTLSDIPTTILALTVALPAPGVVTLKLECSMLYISYLFFLVTHHSTVLTDIFEQPLLLMSRNVFRFDGQPVIEARKNAARCLVGGGFCEPRSLLQNE